LALLSVENVTRRFGGILALDGVSFDVDTGEIVGLIGPNGAGKTTAFNVITRLYAPDAGRVVFEGRDLLATPLHRIVRLGIARTFQNLALFRSMTVLDNVLVGAHARGDRRRAADLLRSLSLDDVAHAPVAGLPYGTQKRVETARALMSEPRLLLLDEPAGGLSHEEVETLADSIRRLQERFALTVLLVEHHMNLVMGVSARVHVLDFGRLIASGTPAEVQRDERVIEAYLGTTDDARASAS
jgi:branched-chain amino acid transport system ATP-binding protein